MLVKTFEKRLADAGLSLEMTDAARELVAREGYEPAYGARPLRRALQRLVENPLARQILAGDFLPGDRVRIDARDGQIVFEKAALESEPVAPGETAEPVATA